MIETIWQTILYFFSMFVVVYTMGVSLFYLVMILFAALSMFREHKLNSYLAHKELNEITYTKPVSILIPAYNEELGVIGSVRSLLSLTYPQIEVIVINDGSTDSTLEKMVDHFQMVQVNPEMRQLLHTKPVRAVYQSELLPNLYMIDKENGGKADSLNAGINLAHYSHFCSIDGDSILERDSLIKVMKPIIDSNDDVIASGGTVRIANGSDIQMGVVQNIKLSSKPLVIYQIVEYIRAFLIGRIGLSRHNLLLIISGAFGVFSKEWVVEAGGYSANTLGEDMELVVRLQRIIKEKKLNKRIVFVPDPVCWTEAPETMRDLRRQRNRWHRGLLESLSAHRRMFLNPRYGPIGMVSIPYFWIVEFLGPVVELGGYIFIIISFILGNLYYEFAVLLLLVLILYGSIISLLAMQLEQWNLRKYSSYKDVLKLYFYSLTEIIWYRPLTVIWRVEGIIQFFFRKRSWGEMKRKGLSS
ncbi:glycosyltransferase family 2 protein [Paenibacillus marinisediminis]